MAELYEGMQCPVCKRVIDLEGPFFATTDLEDDDGVPLEGSDSAMHWPCLFAGREVERFLAQVDASSRRSLLRNPYWEVLVDDEEVLVAANPDPTHDRDRGLLVRVLGTGLEWDLSLSRFPRCLDTLTAEPLAHVPPELRARVARVAERLAAEAPRLAAALRRLGAPLEP